MPNWCDNSLTVTGPRERVLAFDKALQGRADKDESDSSEGQRRFSSLLPVPEEVEKAGDYPPPSSNEPWNSPKYGYGWRILNWGTKWDAHIELTGIANQGDGLATAYYVFQTAWSPPEPWLIKVAQDWPDLRFTLFYYEPGQFFAGEVYAEGGEIVSCYYEETEKVKAIASECFGENDFDFNDGLDE